MKTLKFDENYESREIWCAKTQLERWIYQKCIWLSLLIYWYSPIDKFQFLTFHSLFLFYFLKSVCHRNRIHINANMLEPISLAFYWKNVIHILQQHVHRMCNTQLSLRININLWLKRWMNLITFPLKMKYSHRQRYIYMLDDLKLHCMINNNFSPDINET